VAWFRVCLSQARYTDAGHVPLCDRALAASFSPAAAIAAVTSHGVDPALDACSGVCAACYDDDVGADDLMRRVAAYYQDRAKDHTCIARRIDFRGGARKSI
jgi:hypothetical protein